MSKNKKFSLLVLLCLGALLYFLGYSSRTFLKSRETFLSRERNQQVEPISPVGAPGEDPIIEDPKIEKAKNNSSVEAADAQNDTQAILEGALKQLYLPAAGNLESIGSVSEKNLKIDSSCTTSKNENSAKEILQDLLKVLAVHEKKGKHVYPEHLLLYDWNRFLSVKGKMYQISVVWMGKPDWKYRIEVFAGESSTELKPVVRPFFLEIGSHLTLSEVFGRMRAAEVLLKEENAVFGSRTMKFKTDEGSQVAPGIQNVIEFQNGDIVGFSNRMMHCGWEKQIFLCECAETAEF